MKYLIIALLLSQLIFIRMSCIQWGAYDYQIANLRADVARTHLEVVVHKHKYTIGEAVW